MVERAERRRRTEGRILDAARRRFGEHGFERTTIRAVAADAGVDPALVMQYFGSKAALFSAAVRQPVDIEEDATPEQLAVRVLAAFGGKLGGLPPASLVTLRSMLTHPQAEHEARATLDRQAERIAAAMPGEDAALRAGLVVATILGVTVARELLHLEPLRDADPGEITDALRPAIEALADPRR